MMGPDAHDLYADGRRRRMAHRLVVVGFATWSAGLALWELSWVGGLAASVVGGVALTDGLGRLTSPGPGRRSSGWTVGAPVGVSLLLISQGVAGVGRSDYVARVALVGVGTLAMLVVVLRILDKRLVIERQLAERTLADQRRRLAGEVHDVVGHTLAASMLHTSAARLSVRSDPDAAIASLERAEEQSRRSMDDIRSVVRLLRDSSGTEAPTPLAGELPELVAGFRSAGVDVTFSTTGVLDGLRTATALTVYRVVQEGLTNAARHGTGKIDVTAALVDGGRQVEVEIANDRSIATSAVVMGNGITGMRERVSAIGGTLEAGPVDGGRLWVLCARIPT